MIVSQQTPSRLPKKSDDQGSLTLKQSESVKSITIEDSEKSSLSKKPVTLQLLQNQSNEMPKSRIMNRVAYSQ
jgi:biopolymer transport protein ExbD